MQQSDEGRERLEKGKRGAANVALKRTLERLGGSHTKRKEKCAKNEEGKSWGENPNNGKTSRRRQPALKRKGGQGQTVKKNSKNKNVV